MTEALLFVGVGSVLIVGVATFTTAILTLRSARRYVDLAEERMESLREGQVRLLRLLHEERGRTLRSARPQCHSPATEGPVEDGLEHREPPQDESSLQEDTPAAEGLPVSPPETWSGPKPENTTGPSRAVWHPHPDDDVTPRGTVARQAARRSDISMKMFRTLYDRYLDNYEGYVKLAERLHRSRVDDEITAGSPAEREWEERLRRTYDGIERTVARLDILEESNPELATDERVSQRSSTARSHSELGSQHVCYEVRGKEQVTIFRGP